MLETRILMSFDMNQRAELLKSRNLNDCKNSIDFGIFDNDKLVAVCGCEKNIIRTCAVDSEYEGQGLLATLVTEAINIIRKTYKNAFVFTKPESFHSFENLGFKTLARTDTCVLLESGLSGFEKWAKETRDLIDKTFGKNSQPSSIVMNANPMTLGHQHLIKTAAKSNKTVVFVVEEDSSEIPFNLRYSIVNNACKDIKNVLVIPSGPYIISQATFPTYFIKDTSSVSKAYADLDSAIFSEKIMPALQLKNRFLGEEPTDELTSVYVKSLRNRLGDKAIVIPRLNVKGKPISASDVRKLINKNNYEEILPLVGEETLKMLKNRELNK